jgi:DNA gyrase subunit A
VIEKIQDLVQAKKLQGISDLADYTDRTTAYAWSSRSRTASTPTAVLEQLYRLTPMEESFGINNVCLVEGQPRTLGSRTCCRSTSTTASTSSGAGRCSAARRPRPLHLVEGLLIAILDIDEVIAVIRSSDDTAQARERLMASSTSPRCRPTTSWRCRCAG